MLPFLKLFTFAQIAAVPPKAPKSGILKVGPKRESLLDSWMKICRPRNDSERRIAFATFPGSVKLSQMIEPPEQEPVVVQRWRRVLPVDDCKYDSDEEECSAVPLEESEEIVCRFHFEEEDEEPVFVGRSRRPVVEVEDEIEEADRPPSPVANFEPVVRMFDLPPHLDALFFPPVVPDLPVVPYVAPPPPPPVAPVVPVPVVPVLPLVELEDWYDRRRVPGVIREVDEIAALPVHNGRAPDPLMERWRVLDPDGDYDPENPVDPDVPYWERQVDGDGDPLPGNGAYGDPVVRVNVARMEYFDVPLTQFTGVWSETMAGVDPHDYGCFVKGTFMRVKLPTAIVCTIAAQWAHVPHDVKREQFLAMVALAKWRLREVIFASPEEEVIAAMYVPVVAYNRWHAERQSTNALIEERSWDKRWFTGLATVGYAGACVVGFMGCGPILLSLFLGTGLVALQERVSLGHRMPVTSRYVPPAVRN